MSKEIKGYLVQNGTPTPENPVEIKTIVCNGIEYPVEYLTQTNVVVEGKKYIELQQENQQLKEQLHKASMDIQELVERDIMCPTNCEMLDKYKSVLDEIREYIKYNATSNYFDADTNMFRREVDILQILDKVK